MNDIDRWMDVWMDSRSIKNYGVKCQTSNVKHVKRCHESILMGLVFLRASDSSLRMKKKNNIQNTQEVQLPFTFSLCDLNQYISIDRLKSPIVLLYASTNH